MSTTNNTNKNNTMNITRTNNSKSRLELIREARMGVTVETLYIDGIPFCPIGYANEHDKEACLAAVQKMVDNSDKKGIQLYRELQGLITTMCAMQDAEIPADEELEEVTVEGVKLVISYSKKVIYTADTIKEKANMEDLKTVQGKEAIKAILIERAKNIIISERTAYEMMDDEDDYDCDGCDGGCCYCHN